jgi:hypothetical protein
VPVGLRADREIGEAVDGTVVRAGLGLAAVNQIGAGTANSHLDDVGDDTSHEPRDSAAHERVVDVPRIAGDDERENQKSAQGNEERDDDERAVC